MSISDIFVLPTYTDVWGLVIIEALSCGIPIVTTNKCNAGLEFINDGINGFIVPIKNSNKLNTAIKKSLMLKKKNVEEYDKKIMMNYTIENSAKDMIEEFGIGDENE